MIKNIIRILVIGLVGLSSVGRADHLPTKQQARGKPETRLAGIDLRRDKLAEVLARYGPPTKTKAWEQDNPKVSNSYDYYWNSQGITLKIVVERLPNLEYLTLIDVTGPRTRNRIGRTGRGLSLGDSLRDFHRFYGSRTKVRNISKFDIHDVMVQWHREEYSLVATLDRNNRITRLTLVPPE